MDRTPVMGRVPVVLFRNHVPPRTPVIGDVAVQKVGALLDLPSFSENDMHAAIEVAAAAPESDPIWFETRHAILRHSLPFFAQEMLRGPKEAPYNGRFLIGPHHLDWGELVSGHKRINILAARDHGKSFFFTLAYPIWKAGFSDPGSEGIVFSATQPQAELFLGKIKDELLTNPKLAHLIPYSGDRFWSAKRIKLRNGSVIRAAGFGVKVRGAHPDWCVCDDVLNDDDIYSETIRQRNIDYFLSAIAGMVHRKKQLIVVGTPMHQADLYAALDQSGQYRCAKYPALKNGNPLWPARYSMEDLTAKKAELKSAARFAREFLCEPLTDEASLFPGKLFSAPGVRQPYKLGLPAAYWEQLGYSRYMGVDIALSAEVGADWFVIFTIAVDPEGNYWLAGLRRERGVAFSAQIDMIKAEYALYQPDMVYIEANQAQRVWSDELVRTTNIPVRRFFTTGIGGSQPMRGWKRGATSIAVNKHHIDRGVPGMRLHLEHGKWRIPRGDDVSIAMTDVWIGEMGMMGWVDGKVRSVGEHDDTVMACWMTVAAAEHSGSGSLGFADSLSPKAPILTAPLGADAGDPGAAPVPRPNNPATALEMTGVFTALDQGLSVEISRESYLAGVRDTMQTYAGELVDSGSSARAVVVLQEIKRLDTIHGWTLAQHNLAGDNGDEYRAEQRRPLQGAPTASDMGFSE